MNSNIEIFAAGAGGEDEGSNADRGKGARGLVHAIGGKPGDSTVRAAIHHVKELAGWSEGSAICGEAI
jgi:hypothetical protein